MSHIVDAHVAYIKAIADLSRDKVELLERIKRLEEAGDRMADVLTWSAAIQYKRSPTVAAWRKAKEAKP